MELSQQNKILNAPQSIIASIILGLGGIFMFILLPLFVNAISTDLALNSRQVGYLASADLFGFFLGSISSLWWARKVNWRVSGLIVLAMIILMNALSIRMMGDINLFLFLRVLAGIGQGAAVSIYSAHIGDTQKPERYYANFLIAQTIIGVIGLYFLPAWIAQIGGKAILWVHIGLCLIGVVSVGASLPRRGLSRGTGFKSFSLSASGLALLGLLLFFIAQGGTWAYMQKIGSSLGLSDKWIGMSLSLSMIGAFLGASSAAIIATKYGRKLPLILVGLGQPLCLLLIFMNLGTIGFLIGSIAFLFLWNVGIPYIMGILIGADQSGQSILLANPLFALGVSIAPIIISQFVISKNYTSVGWVGAIAMLASVSLLLIAIKNMKNEGKE